MVALYGQDRKIKTWIKSQLPNFTPDSYARIIDTDGAVFTGALQSRLKMMKQSPATAQDLIELSHFLKTRGRVDSFTLLIQSLGLSASTRTKIDLKGELTESGKKITGSLRMDINNGRRLQPGPVKQLLDKVPPPTDFQP